jgi:hypothetical protein
MKVQIREYDELVIQLVPDSEGPDSGFPVIEVDESEYQEYAAAYQRLRDLQGKWKLRYNEALGILGA